MPNKLICWLKIIYHFISGGIFVLLILLAYPTLSPPELPNTGKSAPGPSLDSHIYKPSGLSSDQTNKTLPSPHPPVHSQTTPSMTEVQDSSVEINDAMFCSAHLKEVVSNSSWIYPLLHLAHARFMLIEPVNSRLLIFVVRRLLL